MKHHFIPSLIAFAVSLFLLQGCATSNVQIQVLKPAGISLPQNIQTIAVINRFKPAKGSRFLNILEGALTGEGIRGDRNAASASLEALTDFMARTPRFNTVIPEEQFEGYGQGSFPPPFTTAMVDDICRTYNAQAILTIEAFDSDTRNRCNRFTREVKQDGETVTEVFYVAEQFIDVTVGWRLYSAETGTLIDEYRMVEQVGFDAEGTSKSDASNNLPSTSFMIDEMGQVTGEAYAHRIAPIYFDVDRNIFTKGTTALKLGKKKARMNDWKGAEKHWDVALTHEKDKVKGRALHNLAIATEVRGDLERAYKMAMESYNRYGNKKAGSYSYVLLDRMREREVLDQQMKGAPRE